MNAPRNPGQIQQIERAALAALCGGVPASACKQVLRRLASYTWRDTEHRVVYDAIRKIAAGSAESFRQRLPAEATRMGFPAVEWENYFRCENEDPADRAAKSKKLCELVDELLSAAPAKTGNP